MQQNSFVLTHLDRRIWVFSARRYEAILQPDKIWVDHRNCTHNASGQWPPFLRKFIEGWISSSNRTQSHQFISITILYVFHFGLFRIRSFGHDFHSGHKDCIRMTLDLPHYTLDSFNVQFAYKIPWKMRFRNASKVVNVCFLFFKHINSEYEIMHNLNGFSNGLMLFILFALNRFIFF